MREEEIEKIKFFEKLKRPPKFTNESYKEGNMHAFFLKLSRF